MTAMIITGKKRGGPRQMAAYLLDKGENETVTVREVNGFVTKNVKDALAEMWAVADGSKAKDFLYHVSINPRIGATLTQTQWQQAVDTLEKNLNLVGHQRVVIEHIKKGRPHYHVVWNRVNPATGRSKKLSFDRRVCRATALQLGSLFKLEPTPNKGQSFKRGDIERGKRTGIDPQQVKSEVTALWNKSKSGKEFVASLAKQGYTLARGDRNQFVIIDKAGSVHGLTRRIHGATVKTVKRGMADIDPATLPSIAAAKKQAKTTRSKTSFRDYGNTRTISKSISTGSTAKTRPVAPPRPGTGAAANKSPAPVPPLSAARAENPQFEKSSKPAHTAPRATHGKTENPPARPDSPTSANEIDGILDAITNEVQGAAAGASDAVMSRYDGLIDQAKKTLPPNQVAAAIRALTTARAVELAAISKNAAIATAGRRKAAMEQRGGAKKGKG
ncbi:MAG: relaxase/mobilization nuclease domain-containing protein, partial [Alphaproteobacteria bacterium]